MEHPTRTDHRRFSRLGIIGHPNAVTDYAIVNGIKVLTIELKPFDEIYNASIRSKSLLKTAPWVEKLFDDSKC